MSAQLHYPWFGSRWERVVEQHQHGRLPHALLLAGPAGIGKVDFATALGNLLLCQAPQGDQPCGCCHSCELRKAGHHPDLVQIRPEAAGKPIKVDQVRALIDRLHSTAQQGGYRIVLLEPAESLNTSSANALLKILEEPGDNTLLILITHQPGQLMPTIRSRCQRVDFGLPSQEQAVNWLADTLGLEAERAVQLLGFAHGGPLRARDLYQSDALEQRKILMSGLADLLRDRMSASELAVKLGKCDLLNCLDWLASLLNDLVRMQMTSASMPKINQDMRRMLEAVAKQGSSVRIFELADRIQQERVSLMLRQNPNRQLLLETLLLRWSALVR
ncbi:MAG: DNA polymerase III subunit delta' [Marinobacterium sp.]